MSPENIGRLARWLPQNAGRLRRLGLRRLEHRLRCVYDSNQAPYPTTLHGFPCRVNGGNPYPFLIADHPVFNRPLVDLANFTSRKLGRPLVAIDVGASLGNTILLLQEKAGSALARIHSIEADDEFFRLLEYNSRQFPNVRIHRAMLSSEVKAVASLVHHHRGSATAAGGDQVTATTLDDLLLSQETRFDLLKIDIDGSDGEALAGAQSLLRRDLPAVIFEWHPALIERAGNKPATAFNALKSAGYGSFLWFRNTGHFSHFSQARDEEIVAWDRFLRAMQPHEDPHFDIVALPPALESLAFSLASQGKLP